VFCEGLSCAPAVLVGPAAGIAVVIVSAGEAAWGTFFPSGAAEQAAKRAVQKSMQSKILVFPFITILLGLRRPRPLESSRKRADL
jgi:hypothetical protein